MKDFKQLGIWKNGMNLTSKIYSLTGSFPNSELFGLTSQMRRAVVSVPLNIAEGNSRTSDKEKLRFMEFSMGSLNELETLLLLSKDLQYISEEELDNHLNLLYEEQRMLTGFMNRIKEDILNEKLLKAKG
jgi:four helix bundle protein